MSSWTLTNNKNNEHLYTIEKKISRTEKSSLKKLKISNYLVEVNDVISNYYRLNT